MKTVFKLEQLLETKGMSRRELSRISGVRQQTINDMCNNLSSHIPLNNLAAICEVLECEISDVLILEKEPAE